MLVNSKEMLKKAKRKGYGVPATDVFNLESLKGVLEASKECDCPLIIALAEVHLNVLPLEDCVLLVKHYASQMKQDIVLHLDHGYTPEIIKEAIDLGFTSVMFDGSSLPFEENVKITKSIVEYAQPKGVCVEAEIGHVGSGDSGSDEMKDKTVADHSQLTTAKEAIAFAKESGVDSLAISIGTAHGNYVGTPHLDFDRLVEINQCVDIPLVLHGGSGTGYENLNKAVCLGISKINIFTDLMNAATASCSEQFTNISYFEACSLAQEAIKNKLKEYYSVFMTEKSHE